MRKPFHEDWHREHAMTFKRGLHVFWEKEFMPAVLELTPAIAMVLDLIKYLLFAFWVVLPYFFLITGMENTKPLGKLQPHWFVYLGVAGIISQAIVVVVLFIRHVLHLGSTGDTR
jgi:hypothetical protein